MRQHQEGVFGPPYAPLAAEHRRQPGPQPLPLEEAMRIAEPLQP